jgi:hypothetical protein
MLQPSSFCSVSAQFPHHLTNSAFLNLNVGCLILFTSRLNCTNIRQSYICIFQFQKYSKALLLKLTSARWYISGSNRHDGHAAEKQYMCNDPPEFLKGDHSVNGHYEEAKDRQHVAEKISGRKRALAFLVEPDGF